MKIKIEKSSEMAFSSLFKFPDDVGVHNKRSDAALKRYDSVVDPRVWSTDKFEKSMCIQGILKRKSGENDQSLREALENVDGASKDVLLKNIAELQKEIQVHHQTSVPFSLNNSIFPQGKDVELDKIHKMFKQASRKLEETDGIGQVLKVQQKESEEQLKQLKVENAEKDEKLKLMERNQLSTISEKENSSVEVKSEAIKELTEERDLLKHQLCKMAGVKNLLCKLKSRDDEADKFEHEIAQLKR